MSVMLDTYVAQGGRLHSKYACRGEWCVIHNPSDHHMKDWPRILRESALVERQCTHGIGHPDPDSIAFFRRVRGEERAAALQVHGCDGCCRTPSLSGKTIVVMETDGSVRTVATDHRGRVTVGGGPISKALLLAALDHV